MRVLFANGLDGAERLSRIPRFGEISCGPAGLATLLELRLGLVIPEVSTARRIVQYHQALQNALGHHERFFSKSFEKDCFASTETLLRWRDGLRLANWRGDAGAAAPTRLRDLADVESFAAGKLAPGLGDRLQRISSTLDTRSAQLDEVLVVEEPHHLPGALREVLQKLGAKFRARPLSPQGAPGTDLAAIQAQLLGGAVGKIPWRGDGSVTGFTAQSENTAAKQVSELLAATRARGFTTTLIAESEARPLEIALGALDEPLVLLGACSHHRPILGFLTLALRLRWQPLDPAHLIEFLAHPVSPLQSGLRYRLASAVAEYPGIGSEKWDAAIKGWRQQLQDLHAHDAAALKAQLTRLDRDLDDWIFAPRVPSGTAAKGVELAKTCDLAHRWAIHRSASAETLATQTQWLKAVPGQR